MVVVQNISKLYRLYDRPSDRLAEMLLFHRRRHRDFWAVRDVSFSVRAGEILGIVGPNGSGKSTLLQIVSGIIRPTSGRVSTEGRIAALLELGAGFNPEFSGRENVFLNSEILGVTRTEIEARFPKIEAFAEIGEFMDRPVKEYSSGMYVRLAFATAIHVDPDILIVDEALAVGDAIFANRCLRKLEELKSRNVTILFVSHDLGLVKRLCHRAILMSQGRVLLDGSPNDVVNRYVALVHERGERASTAAEVAGNSRHGDRTSTISSIEIENEAGVLSNVLKAGEYATIRVHAHFHRTSQEPIVGILIRNRLGIEVFGTNTRLEHLSLGQLEADDELDISFRFRCLLTRQEYTLTVATQHADGSSQDWRDDAIQFTVVDEKDVAGLASLETDIDWAVQRRTGIATQ